MNIHKEIIVVSGIAKIGYAALLVLRLCSGSSINFLNSYLSDFPLHRVGIAYCEKCAALFTTIVHGNYPAGQSYHITVTDHKAISAVFSLLYFDTVPPSICEKAGL